MAQEYTILGVGSQGKNAPRNWDSQYGPMVSYTLKLEGFDEYVDMSQKADTPAPTKGQKIFGTIDMSGRYGPKFKKERQGGNSGWGGGKDSLDIRAQFAIKAAVQLFGNTPKPLSPTELDIITTNAKNFFDMVDTIKGTPAKQEQNEKAKEPLPEPPAISDTPSDDVVFDDINDEPINLDDIPF